MQQLVYPGLMRSITAPREPTPQDDGAGSVVADVLEPRVGWSGCGVCMAQPRLGCSKGAKLVLLLLCAPYPLPASAAEEVASSRPPIETGREETGVLGGRFGGTTSSSSCSMI